MVHQEELNAREIEWIFKGLVANRAYECDLTKEQRPLLMVAMCSKANQNWLDMDKSKRVYR